MGQGHGGKWIEQPGSGSVIDSDKQYFYLALADGRGLQVNRQSLIDGTVCIVAPGDFESDKFLRPMPARTRFPDMV
jgi:hypothetical protein